MWIVGIFQVFEAQQLKLATHIGITVVIFSPGIEHHFEFVKAYPKVRFITVEPRGIHYRDAIFLSPLNLSNMIKC